MLLSHSVLIIKVSSLAKCELSLYFKALVNILPRPVMMATKLHMEISNKTDHVGKGSSYDCFEKWKGLLAQL
jgi:hypothetical protein